MNIPQAILAGVVGAVLLVSSVALCIMEMHVIAVIGGIVGLVCMGFALYNAIKPNTNAAVFMGFTAVVVKDDQKYIRSLKCDSKVTSGGYFFL